MRSLIFTFLCVVLFAPVIPSASAQAQLPPPDYSLFCDSQVFIDVDPETARSPTETIECTIYNQESYSIELSLQSNGDGLETTLSVSEITVVGNGEDYFEVTITAEDGMMSSSYLITTTSEVTKTGELEYSDDEPHKSNGLVTIMQYAAFKAEQHQSESDYNLAGGESIELGYSITNLGNQIDIFYISLYSKTTKVCDVGRAIDEGRTFGECDGGYYVVPISDDCDEKLDIKLLPDERMVSSFMIEPDVTIDLYYTVSEFIDNSSCWPTDSNGDLSLDFDMYFSVVSEFHNRNEDVYGEHFESDASRYTLGYDVEVTYEGDKSLIDEVTPGFESVNLILCSLVAIYVFSRRD